MNTNKKVVLIILLGVGASLLSFLLSNHFSQRNQRNQRLLSRIERLTEKVEIVRLLSKDFIQSGESDAWREINKHIESLQHSLSNPTPTDIRWAQELDKLTDKVFGYHRLLIQIHDPVLRLSEAKVNVQRIGFSFSAEIRDFIIMPYRKDEGEQIYQGKSIDPIKTRIKETAYDLVGLHNQQQLILIELMLDWDLERYRQKKEVIAAALEKHKAQLQYLYLLMGRKPVVDHVIRSLETKMDDLVKYEQQIVAHFTQLYSINSDLSAEGEDLLITCNEFSTNIASEMSHANRLNRNLNWALLAAILTGLSLIGTLLAKDVNHIVNSLRITQFAFDNANIGIHMNTSNYIFREVNHKFAQILGYTKEELETMSILDIDPSISLEMLEELWRETSAKGAVVHERKHRRKDGSVIPVEIYAGFMEFDGQGYAISFVQDISERKQMEQALLESQERLDLALEGANEGIWVYRLDEEVFYFDSRYYTIAGYEPYEFPGASEEWQKRVHKDDLDRVISRMDQYLRGELDIYESDFRFLRKDGSYMWIQTRGKVVAWDDKGNPIRLTGTHVDITERKKAEKALRENEHLLNNILESLNEGLLVLDSDFNCTIFNQALGKMVAGTKANAIGKPPWDVFPALKNTAVEKNIKKTMAGETTGNLEVQLPLPNGELVWFQDSFSPLKNDEGRIIGVVGVVSNITQRKQDEEELRRLRNYLSNIIDSMPSAIVAVDRDGRVTQWNNRTEHMTGLRFEDARNQPLLNVFPRLSGEMARISTSIKERRVIRSSKVPRKMADGTRFEDITIFPLVANGVDGAVIRVDDVTEQVRLEEMMIQSEKMLSVGGLAAGMAHEINNPLAGILQTAGVMANRLGAHFNIPANRKAAEAAGTTVEAIEQFMTSRGIPRMLATITDSGHRLAAIVDNMLSFARKSDATASTHDLATLLDKTTELAATDYDLKKQYDFKQIEIVKAYAQNLPMVPCEGAKIQQVLLNILRNGAQAMQTWGTNAPRFVLRTRFDADRKFAIIEIEDNGPGMDEQTRKRVFEPFFTTKPVGEGTGLGMSVSYFIITESHGGEMAVESHPGAGAKFIIRLPLERRHHE